MRIVKPEDEKLIIKTFSGWFWMSISLATFSALAGLYLIFLFDMPYSQTDLYYSSSRYVEWSGFVLLLVSVILLIHARRDIYVFNKKHNSLMIVNRYLYRQQLREYPLAAIARVKGAGNLIDRKIRLMGYNGKPLDLSLNATGDSSLSRAVTSVSTFIKR